MHADRTRRCAHGPCVCVCVRLTEAASPNQHIVGVRYPSHLLSEVVTALQLSVAPPAAAAAIAGVNGPAAAAIAALLAANIAQEVSDAMTLPL